MEEQKGWGRKHPILLTLLISVGVFLFALSLSPNRYPNTASQGGPTKLNGRVTNNSLGITIYNDDKIGWSKCTALLNSDYKIYVDLDPGANTFSYSQFTRRDGTRFNYYIAKPTGIGLWCENPNAEL